MSSDSSEYTLVSCICQHPLLFHVGEASRRFPGTLCFGTDKAAASLPKGATEARRQVKYIKRPLIISASLATEGRLRQEVQCYADRTCVQQGKGVKEVAQHTCLAERW